MCMQQLALSYEFDTHYEKINQTKLKQIHQTEEQTRCKFLSIPYLAIKPVLNFENVTVL